MIQATELSGVANGYWALKRLPCAVVGGGKP